MPHAIDKRKPRPARDQYAREYNQYMGEVAKYLAQVQRGRRVGKADPQDPRFTPEAEMGRFADASGLSHLKSTIRPQSTPAPDQKPAQSGPVPTFYDRQEGPQVAPKATNPEEWAPVYRQTVAQAPSTIDVIAETMSDPRWAAIPMVGAVTRGGIVKSSIKEIKDRLLLKDLYDSARSEIKHLSPYMQHRQLAAQGLKGEPYSSQITDLKYTPFPEGPPAPEVIDTISKQFSKGGLAGKLRMTHEGRQEIGRVGTNLNLGAPEAIKPEARDAWTRANLEYLKNNLWKFGYEERLPRYNPEN